MNTSTLNKVLIGVIVLIVVWMGVLFTIKYQKVKEIIASKTGTAAELKTQPANPAVDTSHMITPLPVSPLPTALPQLLSFTGGTAIVKQATTTVIEGVRVQNIDLDNIVIRADGPADVSKLTLRQSEGATIHFTKPGVYKIYLEKKPEAAAQITVK